MSSCALDPQNQIITVLFVRHGKAFSDPDLYDPDDGRALTETGHEEATRAAEQIAIFSPQRLISSGSLRARQTAKYIADQTGLIPEELDELNERFFHCLVGLNRQQIVDQFGPDTLYKIENNSDSLILPGEETFAMAKERVRNVFSRILRGRETRIVVVAHGGPHAWLLEAELGMRETQSRVFRLDTGCFSVFDFVRGDDQYQLHRIVALNSRVLPEYLQR